MLLYSLHKMKLVHPGCTSPCCIGSLLSPFIYAPLPTSFSSLGISSIPSTFATVDQTTSSHTTFHKRPHDCRIIVKIHTSGSPTFVLSRFVEDRSLTGAHRDAYCAFLGAAPGCPPTYLRMSVASAAWRMTFLNVAQPWRAAGGVLWLAS